MQSVMPSCSCFNQELCRENSSALKKDRSEYVKSHWKGSEIYSFGRSATQIFLRRLTMVADISEDFEPPSKRFLATPLILNEIKWNKNSVVPLSYLNLLD